MKKILITFLVFSFGIQLANADCSDRSNFTNYDNINGSLIDVLTNLGNNLVIKNPEKVDNYISVLDNFLDKTGLSPKQRDIIGVLNDYFVCRKNSVAQSVGTIVNLGTYIYDSNSYKSIYQNGFKNWFNLTKINTSNKLSSISDSVEEYSFQKFPWSTMKFPGLIDLTTKKRCDYYIGDSRFYWEKTVTGNTVTYRPTRSTANPPLSSDNYDYQACTQSEQTRLENHRTCMENNDRDQVKCDNDFGRPYCVPSYFKSGYSIPSDLKCKVFAKDWTKIKIFIPPKNSGVKKFYFVLKMGQPISEAVVKMKFGEPFDGYIFDGELSKADSVRNFSDDLIKSIENNEVLYYSNLDLHWPYVSIPNSSLPENGGWLYIGMVSSAENDSGPWHGWSEYVNRRDFDLNFLDKSEYDWTVLNQSDYEPNITSGYNRTTGRKVHYYSTYEIEDKQKYEEWYKSLEFDENGDPIVD